MKRNLSTRTVLNPGESQEQATLRIWFLTPCVFGAVWLTLANDITTLLLAPVLVIGFALLASRSSARSKWIALGTFFFSLSIPLGVEQAMISYARGRAAYVHGFGKTNAAIFNLDRNTRYPGTTGPCGLGFAHHSQLVIATHNATLAALHAVFGPMPGTYPGPYPTVPEANASLGTGEPIQWQQLAANEVTIAGRPTRIKRGIGQDLVSAIESSLAPSTVASLPRASIWHDQVLLLELPWAKGQKPLLVFVDRNSGKVFAYEGSLPKGGWSLPRQWK